MLPFGSSAKEPKTLVSEPKSMSHPARSSSLSAGRSSSADPPYAQPTSSAQVVFDNGQYPDRPAPTKDSAIPQAKTGVQELAAARAQLLVVQRRIFEYVGKSFGWTIGWAAVLESLNPKEEMSEVDLDDKEDSDEEGAQLQQEVTPIASTFGISAPAMTSAISSINHFRQFYEVCSLFSMLQVPADTLNSR